MCTANRHHQTTPSAPASRALRWDRIETLSGAMLEKKFLVWVVRGRIEPNRNQPAPGAHRWPNFATKRKICAHFGGPRCAHRGRSDGRKICAYFRRAAVRVLCTANRHHQTTPSAPASRALRWDRIKTPSGAMMEKKFLVWVVRGRIEPNRNQPAPGPHRWPNFATKRRICAYFRRAAVCAPRPLGWARKYPHPSEPARCAHRHRSNGRGAGEPSRRGTVARGNRRDGEPPGIPPPKKRSCGHVEGLTHGHIGTHRNVPAIR